MSLLPVKSPLLSLALCEDVTFYLKSPLLSLALCEDVTFYLAVLPPVLNSVIAV